MVEIHLHTVWDYFRDNVGIYQCSLCRESCTFKDALFDGFINYNPVPETKPYPRTKPKIRIFSKAKPKVFLRAASKNPWYLEILLGLFCGLRKGEIVGLKFSDFDFEKQTVRISRQLVANPKVKEGFEIEEYTVIERDPKTENSFRILKVPTAIMKEEDEINQMKEEGYHFVEQADGFRICLPLDNTPSGNYYEDGFSTGFKKEVELHQYLAETEKGAQWITVPSRKMRVYATGRLVGAPESKEDERCARIFRDMQKSAGLMLKTDRGEAYQIGETAISTLESRARISGNALGKVSRPVLAEILNQCLKVAKGKALIRLSEGKVRAIHSAEKNGYQVFPSRRMRKDTCRHRSS